jgi:hypothetical protein
MFFYGFNVYKITLNCVTDKPSSAKANSMFGEEIYSKIGHTETIS